MFSDTSPEAEKVQIELIRRYSVAQRFAKVRSLTARTVGLSKRAIARANPDLSPQQLQIKFIELHYGKDLADRFRRYQKSK